MNNFARQKKSDISFKSKAKTVIQESKHSLSYSLCKKKKKIDLAIFIKKPGYHY